MNRDLSILLRWARAQTADGDGAPASVIAAIDRLTAKPRRPAKVVSAGRMKPSRMELAQRTYDVRVACVKRADGKCETCNQPATERWPLEMHHLIMGSGKRRQEQSMRNCLMICPMCHDVGHRRILYAGPALLEWAARYGYTETASLIQCRIDKALIADPSWPRNEDETRRLGPDSIPREPQHPETDR